MHANPLLVIIPLRWSLLFLPLVCSPTIVYHLPCIGRPTWWLHIVISFIIFIAGQQQAMVQSQLLHLRTGAVWHMGWSLHVMYDQHFWCGHLLADRMDGGECTIHPLVIQHGSFLRFSLHPPEFLIFSLPNLHLILMVQKTSLECQKLCMIVPGCAI